MAVSRHRQLSRGLEDDALDGVVRALTEDGRIVGHMRRPDRELDLRPDLSRRPDGLADVDGEPTAFDVTLFATDEAQMRTAARVDELKAHATPLIRAVAPSELIAILVHYRLGDAALLSMNRVTRDRTAARLATAIGDALALGRLRTGGPDVYMDEIHPALRITVGAPISPMPGSSIQVNMCPSTVHPSAGRPSGHGPIRSSTNVHSAIPFSLTRSRARPPLRIYN